MHAVNSRPCGTTLPGSTPCASQGMPTQSRCKRHFLTWRLLATRCVGIGHNSIPADEAHLCCPHQIVEAVKMAPLRRVDNSITRLYNSARLVRLHMNTMDAVRRKYRSAWLRWTGMTASGILLGGGLGALGMVNGLGEIALFLLGATGIGGAGAWWAGQRHLTALEKHLFSSEGLDEVFRQSHVVSLAQNDEFIVSLWERVKPQLQVALRTMGPRGIPKVSSSDFADLDDVIDAQVPLLRKAATKAGSIQFNRKFSERIVSG